MRLLVLASALFLGLAGSGRAGEANDVLVRHLYAGSLAEGGGELQALAQSGDPATAAEAQAARGMLAFAAAVERLGQSLHRHGLETPESRMMMLPILRLPVPPNAQPEKLDYRMFRAILQNLVEDLTTAEAALAATGGNDVKFTVDLLQVRLDLDGDGKAGDYETLGAMLRALAQAPAPGGSGMAISFDTADIYWLRGYAQFIMAAAQFALAHDFQATFDKTFHVFFPNAGLPLAKELRRPIAGDRFSEGGIGDAIAFIHLLSWPVAEPARLADVRLRLKAMAALSRQCWQAARLETDDDREWLPNGKQISALTSLPVNDQTIDGWLAVMQEFELILDGRKLVPHWRFDRGMNVRRMFEESKRFDLVLLLTGTDAALYLEDGPLSSSGDWNSLMGVFQGNFLGYALWFN
ncbi:MAG: hypothetical protein ACT4SY_11995 [Hyphomicrobiales bacterium]